MVLAVFLIGLCVGSFLNVVALRLHAEKSITGRSCCPHCGKQLAWYHNLPLISFVVLRGRCAFCRAPVSWQYPLVELASGLLWLAGYQWAASGGSWIDILAFGVFVSFLLTLFVFDVRWYVLPDEVTLPGIALALVFNLARGVAWRELLLVTALGAAFFGLQYALSRGRWVGSGDIRLGALMGAMLGTYTGLGVALLVAYVGGSLVAVALVVLGRRGWKSQLPFGAFLAPATVVALLWGGELWAWYQSLLW